MISHFRYVVLNMGFGLGKGFEVDFLLPNLWTANPLEAPANYYTTSNRNGQVLTRCNGCTRDQRRLAQPEMAAQNEIESPAGASGRSPVAGSLPAFRAVARVEGPCVSAFRVDSVRQPQAVVLSRSSATCGAAIIRATRSPIADFGSRPFNGRRAPRILSSNPAGWQWHHQWRQDRRQEPAGTASLREVMPGHFLSYNDMEGTRASVCGLYGGRVEPGAPVPALASLSERHRV